MCLSLSLLRNWSDYDDELLAIEISAVVRPFVLDFGGAYLDPAWKSWGSALTVKPNTIILHSRQDDVIPFADPEELLANSGLPHESLVEVGRDHRLADNDPLQAMLKACETLESER